MEEAESTPSPTTAISIPNLAAELELSSANIVAGEVGLATLVLRNTGLAAIDFQSDSILVGRLLDTSRNIVSVDSALVRGTGIRIQLPYKRELELPVRFATSGRGGGHLSPGVYFLSVQLPVRSQAEAMTLRVVDVPSVELTVHGPSANN
jgi:hypothetical protein